jgi:hypothetical protein
MVTPPETDVAAAIGRDADAVDVLCARNVPAVPKRNAAATSIE